MRALSSHLPSDFDQTPETQKMRKATRRRAQKPKMQRYSALGSLLFSCATLLFYCVGCMQWDLLPHVRNLGRAPTRSRRAADHGESGGSSGVRRSRMGAGQCVFEGNLNVNVFDAWRISSRVWQASPRNLSSQKRHVMMSLSSHIFCASFTCFSVVQPTSRDGRVLLGVPTAQRRTKGPLKRLNSTHA
jgi:hypothetical protein